MTAEQLAKMLNEACCSEGPKQKPPRIILHWSELSDGQKQLKIAVAAKVLDEIMARDTEEIKR